MLLAGLWEDTPDQGGGVVRTACIITTPANALVEPIHDRMPAILTPEEATRWLRAPDTEAEGLTALLRPYEGEMRKLAVERTVNSPAQDGPECIKPAEEGQRPAGGASLFPEDH